MRPILVLVKKDFLLFRRDRASLLLTFVVPFALIYLFGQIFGIHRSNSGFGTAQLIGGWAVQFLLFALVLVFWSLVSQMAGRSKQPLRA